MLSWHSSSLEVVILKSLVFDSVFLFFSNCPISLWFPLTSMLYFLNVLNLTKPRTLNDFTAPAVLHTDTDRYLLGLLLSMLILFPSHICKQRATTRLPVHHRLQFKETLRKIILDTVSALIYMQQFSIALLHMCFSLFLTVRELTFLYKWVH